MCDTHGAHQQCPWGCAVPLRQTRSTCEGVQYLRGISFICHSLKIIQGCCGCTSPGTVGVPHGYCWVYLTGAVGVLHRCCTPSRALHILYTGRSCIWWTIGTSQYHCLGNTHWQKRHKKFETYSEIFSVNFLSFYKETLPLASECSLQKIRFLFIRKFDLK